MIELLDAGDEEAGAKLFVETVARRPGAWDEELTAELREVFVGNAPTFLDEARDAQTTTEQYVDLVRRFVEAARVT